MPGAANHADILSGSLLAGPGTQGMTQAIWSTCQGTIFMVQAMHPMQEHPMQEGLMQEQPPAPGEPMPPHYIPSSACNAGFGQQTVASMRPQGPRPCDTLNLHSMI